MTEIVVIYAVAENGVIGDSKSNDIPWRLRKDFQYFKEQTMGYPCIMGDTTYESLPESSRPLPGRENVVLTFDRDYHPEGTTIFYDFDDAIRYVRDKDVAKAFITGGASIYKLGIEVADTLMVTHVHKNIDGDVFAPTIDPSIWKVESTRDESDTDRVSGEELHFTFTTYRRIN